MAIENNILPRVRFNKTPSHKDSLVQKESIQDVIKSLNKCAPISLRCENIRHDDDIIKTLYNINIYLSNLTIEEKEGQRVFSVNTIELIVLAYKAAKLLKGSASLKSKNFVRLSGLDFQQGKIKSVTGAKLTTHNGKLKQTTLFSRVFKEWLLIINYSSTQNQQNLNSILMKEQLVLDFELKHTKSEKIKNEMYSLASYKRYSNQDETSILKEKNINLNNDLQIKFSSSTNHDLIYFQHSKHKKKVEIYTLSSDEKDKIKKQLNINQDKLRRQEDLDDPYFAMNQNLSPLRTLSRFSRSDNSQELEKWIESPNQSSLQTYVNPEINDDPWNISQTVITLNETGSTPPRGENDIILDEWFNIFNDPQTTDDNYGEAQDTTLLGSISNSVNESVNYVKDSVELISTVVVMMKFIYFMTNTNILGNIFKAVTKQRDHEKEKSLFNLSLSPISRDRKEQQIERTINSTSNEQSIYLDDSQSSQSDVDEFEQSHSYKSEDSNRDEVLNNSISHQSEACLTVYNEQELPLILYQNPLGDHVRASEYVLDEDTLQSTKELAIMSNQIQTIVVKTESFLFGVDRLTLNFTQDGLHYYDRLYETHIDNTHSVDKAESIDESKAIHLSDIQLIDEKAILLSDIQLIDESNSRGQSVKERASIYEQKISSSKNTPQKKGSFSIDAKSFDVNVSGLADSYEESLSQSRLDEEKLHWNVTISKTVKFEISYSNNSKAKLKTIPINPSLLNKLSRFVSKKDILKQIRLTRLNYNDAFELNIKQA